MGLNFFKYLRLFAFFVSYMFMSCWYFKIINKCSIYVKNINTWPDINLQKLFFPHLFAFKVLCMYVLINIHIHTLVG